jgi:hypothetical protein
MSRDTNQRSTVENLLTELGVVPPERSAIDKLNADQQEVIDAYRAGRLSEEEFQRRLADDPALAQYVRSRSTP